MSTSQKEIKKVTVPLGVEQMKEFFENKNLLYYVNYAQSSLKEIVFLTYLSNLDLPFEIDFEGSTFEDKERLFKVYMSARNITKSDTLRLNLANIILRFRGVDTNEVFTNLIFSEDEIKIFIANNKDALSNWNTFLESTVVFAIHSIEDLKEKFKPGDKFETIEDPKYVGLNIVNFFSIPSFMELFFSAPMKGEMKYFRPQFEENMFRGKNLFAYFTAEENSIFYVFLGLANGEISMNEIAGFGLLQIGS